MRLVELCNLEDPIHLEAGRQSGVLEWTTATGEKFRVAVLEDDIVRVQVWPDGKPRTEQTWTIAGVDGDVPLDGRRREDLSPFSLPSYDVVKVASGYEVSTQVLRVTVQTQGSVCLKWHSVASEEPFAMDTGKRAYVCDKASPMVRHYMHRKSEGESYYGFGEHSGPLNKKGRRMRMVCLDAMGYDAESTGCLYKHFPVYITYLADLGVAYGLLYDTMCTGIFDMGNEIDAFRGLYKYYQQDHGDLDYYMLYGPTVEDVVQKIARLTGKPRLPPKWALGYLGSTMTYTEAPNAQEQLSQFPVLCEKHDVPCDGFHLSSGYTVNAEGVRCVFTWNHSKIPDPACLVSCFHQHGIRLIPNVKPWLLTCHPRFEEVQALGGFLKNGDGSVHVEEMWSGGSQSSGHGSYIDFTGSAGFDWWKNCVKSQLLEYGMDAVWNDNNEYEVWDDELQLANGLQLGIAGRPLQAMLMARSSLQALLEQHPLHRPFLVSRSACLGMQRYCSQSWSGDNLTSWKTLKYNIPMGLSLSLSGFPNTGHDVGGFAGPAPEPELFIRWVQQGVMYPRFSIHSWNADGTINEPWMYEEALPAIRQAIQFRYQLLPYLYSLHIEASLTGRPILRPLVYYFAHDAHCRDESFVFLLGASLLVAPVYEPGIQCQTVYLPVGEKWCDWRSGVWHEGGSHITVSAPLDGLPPLLVRANSCIPLGPSVGRSVTPALDSKRTLLLFPSPCDKSYTYQWWEDDGVSLDTSGSSFVVTVSVSCTENEVSVCLQQTGSPAPYSQVTCSLPVGDKRQLISPGLGANGYVNDEGRTCLDVPLKL